MVGRDSYVPQRGDIVWIVLNPQVGHEQAGRRPAVVLSPVAYNDKAGLALFCPITKHVKGYPFEVVLPPDLPVDGVVLADQVKCLDWKARQVEFIGCLPGRAIAEILEKFRLLVE